MRKALLLIVLCLGCTAALAPVASALTVRQMAWNRYDILLNPSETNQISHSFAAGAYACRGPIAAGLGGGPVGVFVAAATCIPAVTTCAAQAFVKHRNAGMTVALNPFPNYWCWQY